MTVVISRQPCLSEKVAESWLASALHQSAADALMGHGTAELDAVLKLTNARVAAGLVRKPDHEYVT